MTKPSSSSPHSVVDYAVSDDADVVALARIKDGLMTTDRLLVVDQYLVLLRGDDSVRLDCIPAAILALARKKGRLFFRETCTETTRRVEMLPLRSRHSS